MKKPLIILSAVLVLASCKEKAENVVGTNEKGEKLVVNESGDTLVLSQNDSVNIPEAEPVPANAALVKNEDESYSFRYNLKQGETYPFKLKISQNQSMSAAGQSMNLSTSRTVDFNYLVEEAKDNKFTIKATFEGFSESFNSPNGETISYNTASVKPANQDAAQSWTIYKAIDGQSFNMQIDNKGKVLSVSGLDKVIANTLAKLKNDFTADEQKDIKDLLDSSLSNEAIKAQFEESLNIFPDKNLKIGGQWEDSQNLSEGPVKGQNKVTRTFKELKNGKAKIVVEGTQDVSGTQTQNGITANMKNHATITGYIDLDVESGWIKKVNITKKETVNTTYTKDGQSETENGTSTTITTVN
jgi:hypothetical protein